MCKKIGIFIMSFFFVTQSYALSSPEEIQVISVTDTQAELDWEDVAEAAGYYIYYGTQASVDDNYEYEGVELISESNFTLENLNSDTEYFYAISSVSDDNEESDLSQEQSFITLSQGQDSESGMLTFESVDMIDLFTLKLEFSKDVESAADATREFMIVDTLTNTELSIAFSEVSSSNEKEVMVYLENSMNPDTSYRITVLEIYGKNGENIEFGIDGFKEFVTPAQEDDISNPVDSMDNMDNSEIITPSENPNTLEEEMNVEEEYYSSTMQDENYNYEEVEASVENGVAGATLSDESVESGVSVAASQADALPETGPEHFFLIFIAMTVGLVWVRKRG